MVHKTANIEPSPVHGVWCENLNMSRKDPFTIKTRCRCTSHRGKHSSVEDLLCKKRTRKFRPTSNKIFKPQTTNLTNKTARYKKAYYVPSTAKAHGQSEDTPSPAINCEGKRRTQILFSRAGNGRRFTGKIKNNPKE